MLTRRDFLQVTAATAALMSGAPFSKVAAQQKITQEKWRSRRFRLAAGKATNAMVVVLDITITVLSIIRGNPNFTVSAINRMGPLVLVCESKGTL